MRSLLISKIIRDIHASKGKRKGCHGLNHSLETDGYIPSIVNWVGVTKPERIDSLVDYTEELERKVEALAAENAQMLNLLSDISGNHVEYYSEGECGMFAGVPLDYVSEINSHVDRDVNGENPFAATDAVLAEVRAQGVEIFINENPCALGLGVIKSLSSFVEKVRSGTLKLEASND